MSGYGWIRQMQEDSQSRSDQTMRNRFGAHQKFMLQQRDQQGRSERMNEYMRARGGGWKDRATKKAWQGYTQFGGARPGEESSFGGSEGSAPAMGDAPVYEKPEYDEDKVSTLTQKRAAPGVRRLRETTQQAMGATYDNPNVKRMTVRDALAGYGTGLENVMAGAGTTARAEYGQQYAADVNAAMAKYQGDLSRQSQRYDTQSRDYLMGRQNYYWEQRQDYDSDPYSDFEDFYS